MTPERSPDVAGDEYSRRVARGCSLVLIVLTVVGAVACGACSHA